MEALRDFAAAKHSGTKIAMVTAYDAPSARLIAGSGIDCVLVGDSVMMAVHGHADTLAATPEIMALHTAAVARGQPGCVIVGDMPFLAARRGIAHALDAAAALLRAGAHAVKIEGAGSQLPIIRELVEAGIPVMGHLGLQPQSVRATGGYRVQAREQAEAAALFADAHALEEAGAFALVLECIPQELAREVTAKLNIPTIGIGAGPHCDGQVLVWHDLLALNPAFKPRFVRHFGDAATIHRGALTAYAEAVRTGQFPSGAESF
ncbi:3-methyl-2-oxobutanoate hydroxymethyltransferase [Cephaloticoccus primus]|uniref:3-methyl-2-oxobutanoate hydroxymethyltransferase n=1 Tax=Cephaloticoccus primus TaxID=1548207 RepID=A0A139SUH0_9BACT|nr:3-methyl-2-oxobutanoate hydroxymethyltransferase [Cephaloticoccus primus]KXU38102.1 3-methyl-2-oxobutanoate hydroxymethyltransferase [Cephaloticoccus primus]